MLIGLVPRDVVRRRKDEIYEVMDELAGIVKEEDASSWPYSKKECADWASRQLGVLYIRSHDLVPKLRELAHT